MNLVEYALQYAGRGWPVFALSGFKVPYKGSHGHLDATMDVAAIEARWREVPYANIGLATGDIVVLDADGPGGLAKAREIYGGPLPKTLASRTSRGWHLFYRAPPGVLRTYNAPRAVKGGDGLDIKAHGGYVVLPPSINRKTGFAYRWANAEAIAELPACFIAYVEAARKPRGAGAAQVALESGLLNPGARPSRLAAPRGIAEGGLEAMRRGELLGFLAALKLLPATCGYDEWFEIGAAVHDFDPGPGGLLIWKTWCWQSERHREDITAGDCEKKWAEYQKPKPGKALKTKAHIYFLARQVEEAQARETLAKAEKNGQANGIAALPAQITDVKEPIRFIDLDKGGRPRGTCTNARIAIRAFGIDCRHDTFHRKLIVGGQAIDQWAGELSDDAVHMLRVMIHKDFGFDPGTVNAHDAAVQECLQHGFDPVADFLSGLEWDRRPRLDTWMADYLGADQSRLNAEIGRRALVAAVRRIFQPGAKFDQIVVLESPEGRGKSTALEILAGPDCFSDQAILTLDDKGQQEALQGVWIYEIADFAGHSKADIERVKAFASRRVDRARPAYGRARVDRPRRCVFFATTNAETYLKSQTGNRRFWPVRVGRAELVRLERDRDQLWAEAVAVEARSESLFLPEDFWSEIGVLQEHKLDRDAWDEMLTGMKSTEVYDCADWSGKKEWRLSTKLILSHWLNIPADRQTDATLKRLGYTLRRLGWSGPQIFRFSGLRESYVARGYSKPVTAEG